MTETLIIIILFAISVAIIIYYISKRFDQITKIKNDDLGLQILNQNVQSLQGMISDQIGATTKSVNERLDYASRIMMSVNSELGQMREIGSNLKNIQNFLKSPKLRGNLGEQGLKELLSQALPKKYFQFQYGFRNGTKVDAIILFDSGKIPIDSKFPFENFNQMVNSQIETERLYFRREFRKDFKKHIEAIYTKYINQDEGTTDFAFMYIPSESIYFEIINNESDLFEYASHNHVILSSPSTFFYYLRTIMIGLEGKRMTEMSREIMNILKITKQQSAILGDNLSVLGKHIGNADRTFTQVNEQYNKLSDKISNIDLLEEKQEKLLDE